MNTLEDARNWYLAVKGGMGQLKHLAKYWEELPWEQEDRWITLLKTDNVLREASAVEMSASTTSVLGELEDLAILVFFSVFEAILRDEIKAELKPEADRLAHPVLKKAAEEAFEAVDQGSVFKLLRSYSAIDKNLVEQVNQIRRYRNWVAHGRRTEMKPKDNVEPAQAYERLTRFLEIMRDPSPLATSSDSGD